MMAEGELTGVLKVYDKVTFEANTAGPMEHGGGAVSLPFEIASQVHIVLIGDTFAGVVLIL